MALVIAVLVITGGSFVPITWSLNPCVEDTPPESVAVIKILKYCWESSFCGVPDKTPVEELNVKKEGIIVPAKVTVSPTSTSDVVTVYE